MHNDCPVSASLQYLLCYAGQNPFGAPPSSAPASNPFAAPGGYQGGPAQSGYSQQGAPGGYPQQGFGGPQVLRNHRFESPINVQALPVSQALHCFYVKEYLVSLCCCCW